ncbi:MAG: hypothetical protein IJC98_08275 [Clostridia bacterium]|nr:hypothetical protein [Clostridia bacterium]
MFVCKNPEFYKKIAAIEANDCHTHIDAAHMVARGLHDVMLYHMVISDLYSAGCPNGSRLPEEPTAEEAERRIIEAIDYLPKIKNTSCYFALRIILKDLFDWDEPITHDNWRILDQRIKEYGARPNRAREIMKKANIVKSNTELWRGRDGEYDDIFTYSLEWAFFTRDQWGHFDTALLELEHAWNHDEPCPPLPVTLTPDLINFKKKIKTLEDVEVAICHMLDKTPFDKIVTIASHLSSNIHYMKVTKEQMVEALANRENAGPKERDIYANYIFERYLDIYEERGYQIPLAFSMGAEPLPYETGTKLPSESIYELAYVFAAHPKIHFNLSVASASTNQAMCTLCREIPNVSLNAYWWHNFFPTFIERVLAERLDMLAINKMIGFFSDAYCMEWAYAKQVFIRTITANVLWDRIECGRYDEETALEIAKELFYGSASNIYKKQN